MESDHVQLGWVGLGWVLTQPKRTWADQKRSVFFLIGDPKYTAVEVVSGLVVTSELGVACQSHRLEHYCDAFLILVVVSLCMHSFF